MSRYGDNTFAGHNKKIGSGWTEPYAVARKLSDITYVIENSFTRKTFGSCWPTKKLIGDGVSENQYNSDSDESIDIEPKNESDMSSDEKGDNDNASGASLHS